MRPRYELADIIRLYGDSFLDKNDSISLQKRKVLHAILNCRTAELGGHLYKCSDCGNEQIAYNSCRNRHCPKCQIQKREKWIETQTEQLLPVKHFHVVFTLPDKLNSLCLQYPKQLYNALFYAAWQTIKTFAKDEKHLGASTGMTSVLHTWGQNLSLHPHLHCIVPSGGVDKHNEWKMGRGKSKYLFPVKAMSVVYRAVFLKRLRKLNNRNEIVFPELEKLIQELFEKNWVVYCKQSFKGVKSVMEYLGRYSHKVAISNHRIKSISEGNISFRYKDYRHKKRGTISLPANEFLRRFCLHILPIGFVRIRHFGLNAGVNKKKRAAIKQQLSNQTTKEIAIQSTYPTWQLPQHKNCPKCKQGLWVKVAIIPPLRAGPFAKIRSIKKAC